MNIEPSLCLRYCPLYVRDIWAEIRSVVNLDSAFARLRSVKRFETRLVIQPSRATSPSHLFNLCTYQQNTKMKELIH